MDLLAISRSKLDAAENTLAAERSANAAKSKAGKDGEVMELVEKLAQAEKRAELAEQQAKDAERKAAATTEKLLTLKKEVEKLNQGSGFLGLF
jgi:chromosome segregation ATPase